MCECCRAYGPQDLRVIEFPRSNGGNWQDYIDLGGKIRLHFYGSRSLYMGFIIRSPGKEAMLGSLLSPSLIV